MSRRGQLETLRWRDINKERETLMDELREVAPQGTAQEFGRQLDKTVSLISSPTKPAESAGAELNVVVELVIDMLRIAATGSASSESEEGDGGAAVAGEALAAATEDYNRRLAEVRAEFETVQRNHQELLETLERVRRERAEALVERDNAVNAHARCGLVVVPANDDAEFKAQAAEARAEQLLQENQGLKQRVKKQKKELDELYKAFDAVEDAEKEERKQRRRERK
jgi:hypothetical protein